MPKYNCVDLKNVWEGVIPKYFMDLKKLMGGGGGYAKYNCMDLKKCWGGGGMPKKIIFYGLEKMLGGGRLC